MRSQDDRQAAHALLHAAAAVPVTVTAHEVIPGTDEGEFAIRLELSFSDDESPEEDREDVVECGRRSRASCSRWECCCLPTRAPAALSDGSVRPNDEFRLADFVAAIKLSNGELHLDTDYVHGRRMKTRAIVRSQGTGMIETQGRGKAALNWIARLKGDKPVRAVQ